MDGSTVEHEHHDSAESFIDALSKGRVARGRLWLFRGHANAGWPLVPVALRKGVKLRNLFEGPFARHAEQVTAEFEVMDEVLGLLDEQGMGFPDDHFLMRRMPGEKLRQSKAAWTSGREAWPPEVHLSQLALLQHYGAPTRLLDWTRKPLVAAYFAAREAAEKYWAGEDVDDQRIAVWCLHKVLVTERLGDQRDPGRRIELVTGPTGQIPNMAAQAGCFTLIRAVPGPDGETVRTSVDEMAESVRPLLLRLIESEAPDGYEPPWLIRQTLPMDEAPRLLELLHDQFVNATVLFPGYGGAVQAWRELGLWRR